jgi:uridine kinase
MNKIICIAGDSASGKTTLANYLSINLNNCLVYECDKYHLYERNNDIWKSFTQLNPSFNNLELLKEDLIKLKNNNIILRHEYDHSNGTFTELKTIIPNKYIIVVGLHTLYDNFKDISDYKIYINIDDDLKKKWKYDRDIKYRNYNKKNCLLQIERRIKDFKDFIEFQKNNADYIINIDINTNIEEIYKIILYNII